MSDPQKTCRTCGEAQSVYRFWKSKTEADGRRQDCKLCASGFCQNNSKTHAQRMREYRAKRRALQPQKPRVVRAAKKRRPWTEMERARNIAWRAANPENVKAAEQRRWAKYRATKTSPVDRLSDCYVRMTLGLTKDQAPQSLIDAKRAYIMLKRALKEVAA